MTDLQKKELEIFKAFAQICEELNLTYYLVCGSALGAEKYSGFIPWDDDLDVALPREDYITFCDKAREMLPKHLFLQNHKTDTEYPLLFSKIRDCNTTFIEKSLACRDINHGIYIDVFPLDGYPTKKIHVRKLENTKKVYCLTRLCCLNFNKTWKTTVLVKILKLFRIDKNFYKIVERTEKELMKYSISDSNIWCNHGNWQGALEYAPAEQYGIGEIRSFEGLSVRIPEKIDEYLTQKYGQWKNDLPDEKKHGHHYHLICDCNRPYTLYLSQQIEIQRK